MTGCTSDFCETISDIPIVAYAGFETKSKASEMNPVSSSGSLNSKFTSMFPMRSVSILKKRKNKRGYVSVLKENGRFRHKVETSYDLVRFSWDA